MSSCLSSRACGFDLEHIVKWQTTASCRTTSNSSSPSSTLSESSNSPVAISNRKPRTPRKRPNQTYNEAAAVLSMACPNIFSTKHLTKRNSNLPKFTKHHGYFFNEPPELILPFSVIENSGFLLRQQIIEKPSSLIETKVASSCQNPGEMESNYDSMELCDGYHDDFDTESMLDEEIEQGIASIIGNSNSILENDESNDNIAFNFNTCYGYPMELGFGGCSELNFGFGMRNGVRELRNADERNWWSFPTVDMVNTSTAAPAKSGKTPVAKKKKKKKKVEELTKKSESEFQQGNFNSKNRHRLLLKLDYDGVLNAWSDKGSPLQEEIWRSESPGGHTKAVQIDLFSRDGGFEYNVMRSMEKNHLSVFFQEDHIPYETCQR